MRGLDWRKRRVCERGSRLREEEKGCERAGLEEEKGV